VVAVEVPVADRSRVEPAFATRWYDGWIEAWNARKPGMIPDLVTEDFVLDSPTTRHTGWPVQGHAATADYLRYVVEAYPDLRWEVVAPPMFRDDLARVAFSWRGTGHFSGVLKPPGVQGTGRPFDFSGLEVFDFRDGRACYLNASYDLLGLMKQIGLYRGATKGQPA
jgi:SnoaL-like domain